MTARAFRRLVGRFSLPPGAVRHGLIAGTAWGIATSAVITGLSTWTCGGICLADAALTTAIAIVAGTCTIGPLAAFGRRPAEHLPGASESIANRYSAIN